MPKTSKRSKLAKTQFGAGVRGRDAEFRNAPIDVPGDAQAKVVDINIARQFELTQTEWNKLPERPSTAGGPAASSLMQRSAEQRETKDDLNFNPLGAHGTGTTFYSFPLPGSLPTPNNTLGLLSRIQKLSLPTANTPESMEERSTNLNVPQMEIGMALGSPTHQPSNFQAYVQVESSARNETPDSLDTYVDNESHVTAPSKQKASKWKIFGGLFGGSKKGNGGTTQTFYQLQPEGAVVQTTLEADYLNFGEPTSSHHKPSNSRGRGRTNSQFKTEKHKPDMKRAHTAPLNFEFGVSNLGRTRIGPPQISLEGGPLNMHPTIRHTHRGPLLDVDIPSVEMERYSIMFGSLLQKSTGNSSSLLARRQATLDRLKTVNEALASREQELEAKARLLRPRRATSPQPTKSPAFSLFPNTPSRLTVNDGSPSPHRRSPLQRSNTSPAALSPSRPSFAPGPENVTHATLMAPGPHLPTKPTLLDNTNQRVQEIISLKQTSASPPKSQSSTQNWSLEESHLTLDSPSSEIEDEEIYDPTPSSRKPTLDESSWQMIAPQHVHDPASSVSGSITSRSDHSTSTSASSISTQSIAPFTTFNLKTVNIQAPPPNLRSRSATAISTVADYRRKDSEASVSSFGPVSKPTSSIHKRPSLEKKRGTKGETDEERLKTAADVSIARQISVSRQQRQLLIPVKASSNPNLVGKYNLNSLPSLNTMNMNRVTSPLGAVAQAASPVDRNGRPSAERKGGRSGAVNERLVAANVKPSTPMLVVVGSGEKEKLWDGKAVESPISTGSGKIRAGLAVGPHGPSGLSPGEVQGHHHRNSEMVVVERVSVASN